MAADRQAKNAPVRVRARVREEQALALRAEGLSYQKIGDRMGVARATAYKWVNRALDRLLERLPEEAARVRRLELERLDAMQRALWDQAMGGDVKAINTILRIMERRAKLLALDAPERQDQRMAGGLDLSQGITRENVHYLAARIMTVLRMAEEDGPGEA